MTDFDPVSLLTEQYRVLAHSGKGFTEIRIPKKGLQVFVDNEDDFVKTAMGYCKSDCYVGINPRKTKSGKEEDIAYVTTIVFDFDPVRPKDQASTDSQHSEALALASDFAGSVQGLLVDSGSGAHVYLPVVPIPVVAPKSVAESLRNFAKSIQDTYSTATIKVDSTFDLPRIIRCWGSHNCKSNRDCKFISGSVVRKEFRLSDYASPVGVENVPAQSGSAAVSADPVGGGTGRDTALMERFKRLSEQDKKLKRILEGKTQFPSRSEADFAFGAILLRGGFSRSETATLLRLNPLGKSSERSDRGVEQEVERIYEKIKLTIPVPEQSLSVADYEKDLATRTPGIMTGFDHWDRMTAGLKGGRFYVDAGRPTEGKTTRLVQVAVNVAKQGLKVVYFPTECTRASIYDKMVSCASEVNLRNFQFGRFSEDERDRIKTVLPGILALPIIVAENFQLDYEAIEKKVTAERPDYVIVDFLNRMNYKDVNSASELGANVMAIKNLGKYRNIPITLAAQLHRKLPNTEYALSDLKGTGKLEEEGDIVTFVRNLTPGVEPCKAEAMVLKNKFGEPGTIKMMFERGICRFREVDIWPN